MNNNASIKYKIGFKAHGLEVLEIFPENVQKNHIDGKYKYYPTEYYVRYDCGRGVGKEVWFMEEYQINSLLAKWQRKPRLLHKRLHKTLDKKYESYYKKGSKGTKTRLFTSI
jgi:hypothetical protein